MRTLKKLDLILGMYLTFLIGEQNTSFIDMPGNLPSTAFVKEGDYKIGVLLPLHRYSPTEMCGEQLNRFVVYQNVETIVYTIEEINRRTDLLPNATLGFVILDYCSKASTSLSRSLHFVQTSHDNGTVNTEGGERRLRAYNVIGVIGSEASSSSVQMADILSLFKVPQISYISTSPVLSDKSVYEYFSRVVPSDKLQSEALADIISYFNWTYVSIVYSDGSYGTEMYKAVKKLSEKRRHCLAVSVSVSGNLDADTAEDVVKRLLAVPRARVVILVIANLNARLVFSTIRRLDKIGYFTFLGTDSWGGSIQDYDGYEDVTMGSLTIGFKTNFVDRLDNYMKHINWYNHTKNPWYERFFEERYSCKFDANTTEKACNRNQTFAQDFTSTWIASFVMDTVYAYAYALHRALKDCVHKLEDCMTPEDFLQILRNVSFIGEHGLVSFDEFGDGSANYTLRSLRKVNGSYSLDVIAFWDTSSRSFVFFDPSLITWNPLLFSSSTNTRELMSSCSDPCSPGYQAVTTKPSCCWYCEKCHKTEISVIVNGKQICKDCLKDGAYEWPDASRTICLPMFVEQVAIPSTAGFLILVILVIIIVITCTVIILLNRNADSLIISSSDKELSFLILIGSLVTDVLMFTLVVPPTPTTCVIVPVAFHMSFTLTYSPFLIRIYRRYQKYKSYEPSTVGRISEPARNMLTSGAVCFIQVVLLAFTIRVDPPNSVTVMPDTEVPYVEFACHLGKYGFLCPLLFNLLVLLLCGYFAFKCRSAHNHENQNEMKHITISIYANIILWLGFPASYFTSATLVVKSIILGAAVIANAAAFLFLFGSQLHDIFNCAIDNTSVNRSTTTGRPPLPSTNESSPPTIHINQLRVESLDNQKDNATTSET